MKCAIRKALIEAGATELQCRMAWILYAVRGAANALDFISKIAKLNKAGE